MTAPETIAVQVQHYRIPAPESFIQVEVFKDTFDPDDFPRYLRSRMTGTTVKDAAAKLGISRSYLYMLLDGKRKPTPVILQKLGISVAYKIAMNGWMQF